MPIVILFIAGAIIAVVWLAVRNSSGTGHPSDRPRNDTGADATWMGGDGHTSQHHHSDDDSSSGSDSSGDSGSGDAGGGDCGGGGDGGGGSD